MSTQTYGPASPTLSSEQARQIIDGDVNLLVQRARRIGHHLADTDKLTTSQLRNIFGTIRTIQLRWARDKAGAWRELVLLKPKLAYQAKRVSQAKGRDSSKGLMTLKPILETAITTLGTTTAPPEPAQFQAFIDFVEAIVAYHTEKARK